MGVGSERSSRKCEREIEALRLERLQRWQFKRGSSYPYNINIMLSHTALIIARHKFLQTLSGPLLSAASLLLSRSLLLRDDRW